MISISAHKLHDVSGTQCENLDCRIRSHNCRKYNPRKKIFPFLFSSADNERYNTICKKLHISVEFCADKIAHLFREMDKRRL